MCFKTLFFPQTEAEEYLSSFRGFAEPNIELTPQRLSSLRRSRRSKSLDRNKTSNKQKALMAKQQAAALDLISSTNADNTNQGNGCYPDWSIRDLCCGVCST